MKRTLAVLMGMLLLVGVSTAALAKVNVTVNAGLDLAGDHKIEYRGSSGTLDTDSGLSLGLEVTARKGQGEIGGGIELQTPRSFDEKYYGDLEFNFTSFYAVGKYYFQPKGTSGFMVGRIGFDILDGNNEYTEDDSLGGGLYTAFGGGIRFGSGPVRSSLTFLYGINRGTWENDSYYEDHEITYSKLSLIYGVSF